MGLREKFSEQMKEAMKAKDQKRLGAIRLIMAALKDRDIANRSEESREGVSDDEILSLLSKMVKQREESAAAYDTGNRPELAKAERDEIAVIREFMPKQLSPEETKAEIAKVVAEVGATSIKDMGKVMGALKERFAGQMDFAKAGAAVKEALSAPK
jgi:uncharacterized protein YqeY